MRNYNQDYDDNHGVSFDTDINTGSEHDYRNNPDYKKQECAPGYDYNRGRIGGFMGFVVFGIAALLALIFFLLS